MVPLMVLAVKELGTSATVVRGPVPDAGWRSCMQREADRFGIGHLFHQTRFCDSMNSIYIYALWHFRLLACVR